VDGLRLESMKTCVRDFGEGEIVAVTDKAGGTVINARETVVSKCDRCSPRIMYIIMQAGKGWEPGYRIPTVV
jgi:hypothetical protein